MYMNGAVGMPLPSLIIPDQAMELELHDALTEVSSISTAMVQSSQSAVRGLKTADCRAPYLSPVYRDTLLVDKIQRRSVRSVTRH